MTRRKRGHGEVRIPVTFIAAERSLLFEHTFDNPEYADRLVETGGRWMGRFAASELEDILGHVAAAGNHASRAKLRRELDALHDRLEAMAERGDVHPRDAF